MGTELDQRPPEATPQSQEARELERAAPTAPTADLIAPSGIFGDQPSRVEPIDALDAPHVRADAKAGGPGGKFNALFKVTALDQHGAFLKETQIPGRWDHGQLPIEFTGERNASGKWTWSSTNALDARIGTDSDHQGGESIEQWAKRLGAWTVQVYVVPPDSVAITKDQTLKGHGRPGTSTTPSKPGSGDTNKEHGDREHRDQKTKGGGSGEEVAKPTTARKPEQTEVSPKPKTVDGHPEGTENSKDQKNNTPGKDDATKSTRAPATSKANDPSKIDAPGPESQQRESTGNTRAPATAPQPSSAALRDQEREEDRDADDIDADLDDAAAEEDFELLEQALTPTTADSTESVDGGEAEHGQGSKDGQVGGQGGDSGDKARVGGTGASEDNAREGGHDDINGKRGDDIDGSSKGDVKGTAGGSQTYGKELGEGKDGDHGIRGSLGGPISVPKALAGLAEIVAIVGVGEVAAFGKVLFGGGLAALSTSAAIRKISMREVRANAKAAVNRYVRNMPQKQKAAWKALPSAQRKQALKVMRWDAQRQFLQSARAEAATLVKQAQSDLAKAIRSGDKRAITNAKEVLAGAKRAEEAVAVDLVAGRLPINHKYAGRNFPKNKLPKAYRDKSIPISKEGYPDFSAFAHPLKGGKKSVNIKMTGSYKADFDAADLAGGFKVTPPGHTWHHGIPPGKMELIPTKLHEAVGHTGGVAWYKNTTGIDYAP